MDLEKAEKIVSECRNLDNIIKTEMLLTIDDAAKAEKKIKELTARMPRLLAENVLGIKNA